MIEYHSTSQVPVRMIDDFWASWRGEPFIYLLLCKRSNCQLEIVGRATWMFNAVQMLIEITDGDDFTQPENTWPVTRTFGAVTWIKFTLPHMRQDNSSGRVHNATYMTQYHDQPRLQRSKSRWCNEGMIWRGRTTQRMMCQVGRCDETPLLWDFLWLLAPCIWRRVFLFHFYSFYSRCPASCVLHGLCVGWVYFIFLISLSLPRPFAFCGLF